MIEVQHLSKSFKNKPVLQDVSFRALPEEQIAIIGRNGCGKTTLMRILAGIQKPDKGRIICYGHDLLKQKSMINKLCGYVPQENPLIPELSVQDNISLWSGKRGRPEESLIEMFELEDMLSMQVGKLSGGMKRRVSIACALVNWPPVVFMDEPTSALDSYYCELIHDWMHRYRKMNGILVLATHDEYEKKQSTRCLYMNNGEVEEK